MVDFAALLDGPIYKTIGKTATITPASSPGAVTVTAIDLTKGQSVVHGGGAFQRRHTAAIQTVVPAAKVRMSELAEKGLTLDDVRQSKFEIAGHAWRVHSIETQPSPEGEDRGEALLLLQAWVG